MNHPRRRSKQMFNDIFLPEEVRAIREEVRSFAKQELRPRAHILNNTPERRDSFPREIFELMSEAGLYEIPFSADMGGRGLQYPTLATLVAIEELAYYSPGVASALYDGQAILVGKTLDRAQPELRQRYLPQLIKGEFVGAFATSEPEASTDLSVNSMLSVAERVDGGWVVNAHKRWITNSVAADLILLLCRTGDHLTMLCVDMHAPGVTVGDPDLKMGNHAQLTADVHIKDVFVADDHVVGEVGEGLRSALGALMLGRMGIGAIGVGMAQAAMDFAVDYSSKRKVFGQELARFQHWQFVFAEHAQGIENARNLYTKAALRYDQEGQAEVEAAMAKIAGSRLAVEVARDAIQVCGAYGFVRKLQATESYFPLESIYRDAKIGEIYEGANEVQRWIVARNLFGRELTS